MNLNIVIKLLALTLFMETVLSIKVESDDNKRSQTPDGMKRETYSTAPSERIFDFGRGPYYGNYPNKGGYLPPAYPTGGYFPQTGGGWYPGGGLGGGYPGAMGGYPGGIGGGGGYYPGGGGGTNTLGYAGYGGYGGYGGNGGLQSYFGYNNDNYAGNRNLGFGYYTGTNPTGVTSSNLVSGFRGYN